MFEHDADEPLVGTEDGAVNDDRACDGVFGGHVFEFEALGELEVELNRRALDLAAEGILDEDVDFGAVECAVLGIEFVFDAVVGEGFGECRFGLIPEGDFAHVVVGTGGEAEFVGQIEEFVEAADEFDEAADFTFDLVGGDEEMGIVLHELADAREARECAGELVAVQNLAFGDAVGEFAVAVFVLFVEQHRVGAVHGFEAHRAAVDVEFEHGVGIVFEVAARLVEIRVVHDRVEDFDVALFALDFAPEIMELFINDVAFGLPEDAAGGIGMHKEEVEFLAEFAVVAFFGFFLDFEEGVELGFGRPDGAVDALEHRFGRIAAPVGTCDARQLEVLAFAGAADVRACAQIGEVRLFVDGDFLIFDAFDEFEFVGLIAFAEVFASFVLGHRGMFEGDVCLDDFLHFGRDGLEIGIGQGPWQIEVIVETIGDGGADGEFGIGEDRLDGFGHDVACRVTNSGKFVAARSFGGFCGVEFLILAMFTHEYVSCDLYAVTKMPETE